MDNDGWVHVRRKRQGMADNKCKENDNNKSRREGSGKDLRDFDKVIYGSIVDVYIAYKKTKQDSEFGFA
ncbi:hypothetical protein Tco_1097589, partial [Tanacetum coccineum]